QEKVMHSDIICRELSLRDEDVREEIKLQIPTALFREKHLYHKSDIRAAFILILSSPSLLEHFNSVDDARNLRELG
ncbi:hypothetical protein C8J56DRAFT_771075, partial [Mycena floridula]